MSEESNPDSQRSIDAFGSSSDSEKAQPVIPELSDEAFNDYWFQRNAERNIEENHPERNDPGHSWPIGRVEPHQLGNCKRKWIYQWLNAPSEEADPHGIFAIGHYIEEEIIEPWLRDFVEPDHTIDNAIHVSVDVKEIPVTDSDEQPNLPDIDSNTAIDVPDDLGVNQPDDSEPIVGADSMCLTVAGSTDPAIVDPESGDILALTEVKSTGSIDRIDEPKRMHMLQLHAYMKALGITDGYVIYVDRNELLNPKVFEVTFDPDVWDRVTEWVEETVAYAAAESLPPADPPEGWMCNYCEYSNRCGEGRSNLAADMGVRAFVPGYTEYPKNKVEDHLTAFPDVKLTPSLALEYPELAETHDVADWCCPNCTATFAYTEDHFDSFENENFATPSCPACMNVFDEHVYLTVDD